MRVARVFSERGRGASMPIVAAWLFAVALNVVLWGQEMVVARAPGVVCLAQLLPLLPLLLLMSKALIRPAPQPLGSGVLLGTLGAMLALLDLMIYLHPGGLSGSTIQGVHLVRGAHESIGPLPTALLVVLIFVCLLNCQLQGYWGCQQGTGCDERQFPRP